MKCESRRASQVKSMLVGPFGPRKKMKKELFIIPTIHTETPSYTSNHLAEIILSKKPQIIFEELPSNWDDKIDINGQEESAIKIVKQKLNISSEKVDVAFRNEIAESINLYKTNELVQKVFSDETICSKHCQKLKKKFEKCCDYIYSENNMTYEYLISHKFRKSVLKKRILLKNIIKEHSKINHLLNNSLKIDDFFHEVLREEIIAYNAVTKMEKYDRGVLLIGAEHLDIKNKIRKYNKTIKISD